MLTVSIFSFYRFVLLWIFSLIHSTGTTKPSRKRRRVTNIRTEEQPHRRRSPFRWMVRRGRTMFRLKRSSLEEDEEDFTVHCRRGTDSHFHEGAGSPLLQNTIYLHAGYVLWKNRRKFERMRRMEDFRLSVRAYLAYRQYMRRSPERRGAEPTRPHRRRRQQQQQQQQQDADDHFERRRQRWFERDTSARQKTAGVRYYCQ